MRQTSEFFEHLKNNPFILPVFFKEGISSNEPISSLPGHYFLSINKVSEISEVLAERNVSVVAFYAIPARRSDEALEAYKEDGFVAEALMAFREAAPDISILTDLCVCQFTSNGHCRVIHKGELSDELTLENLSRQALLHVRCGADALMPSGMTASDVSTIKKALSAERYESIPIIPQAAKFVSSLYAPFRHAAHPVVEIDKSAYQLSGNAHEEARKKLRQAVTEGASGVIIKPALFHLDLIRWAVEELNVPVIAFSTSGEYQLFQGKSALLSEYHDRLFSCGATGVVSYWEDLSVATAL